MKKSLLILCALLLAGVGAWAQETTPYEFTPTNWVGVSGRSADSGQVTYSSDGSNTITVTSTGANNIALFNGTGEGNVNTTSYYITSDQKYFVVIGTNLHTEATDNTYSQLWWMNGYNYGLTAKPDQVVVLTDETTGEATGEVLFAWDCSNYLTVGVDGKITLSGWTGFGLTSTDESGKSVISYIGFYTQDEIDALITGKPYEFVNTDWVALSDHTGTTATANTEGNTISVTHTDNEAGLGNMGTMATSGANTASYNVTAEQHWFVIKGTDLSTTAGDHTLWWMNGYNESMAIAPTEVVTVTDGSVVLAWDLSKSVAGTNLKNDTNTLSGGTCFGLKSTTGSFTITEISFYTEAEVEELISSAIKPYEFNAEDWVALADHTGTTVEAGEDNTISVTYTDTEAGLSNSATATNTDTTLGITTGLYTITKEQCWFVIVGKGLSTNNDETNGYDSQLWWMNGANYGTWYPTKVVKLEDEQVLIAWDLSTMPEIDVNLQDESDLLDGWTCFGLKAADHSNGGSFTISDINFYTEDEVEEISSGDVHFCTANLDHWTLTQTGGGTNGALQRDTWATQNDADMSVPFMEYYVNEGNDKNVTLSAATISHETLTLEPGKYKVSMDIRIIEYDAGSINDGTKFKANDVEEDLLDGVDGTDGTYGEDTDAHEDLFGTYTLYVEITEDKKTLDISLTIPEGANYSWIMWKNLTVTAIDSEPTVEWTLGADYGTLMLPFAYTTLPEELTAYTISSVSDDMVTLSEGTTSIEAGVPYIIGGTASETAITFSGMPTAYNVSYTEGYLTGVQKETTAPAGSYVLQLQDEDEGAAFYLVESDNSITVGAYHCYLNYTSTTPAKLVVNFPSTGSDDVATRIDAVESSDAESEAIYDLSGRRVAKAQKGIYIVNGKKMVIK